jgi:hypothetical protein
MADLKASRSKIAPWQPSLLVFGQRFRLQHRRESPMQRSDLAPYDGRCLRSRKRNDIRQHAIRVRVRQGVCGILVDNQAASGDQFVSWAPSLFQ